MFRERVKSDSGLMGPTHALMAIAMTFLITWLASDFMLGTVFGSYNSIVFISAVIIIIGASLMPDLDAVQSTSINTLGPIGVALSKIMRATSSIIQKTFRSSSDSKDPDPHRGFWHTILSALLIGFIVTGLTSIKFNMFTIWNFVVTFDKFIVVFIIFISIQLLIASLFKSLYKKSKGSITGGISMGIGSLVIAVTLISLLPPDLSYNWVGAAVTFGWIAHILGDMITVSGVPLLFPLKYRGKRWWDFRLPLGIKAGGWIEKSILVPLFLIIIIIAAVGIIPILK